MATVRNAECLCKACHCLQAEKLDELLKKRGIAIDRVLNFDVPDSTLVSALHCLFSAESCMLPLLERANWCCALARQYHSEDTSQHNIIAQALAKIEEQ